MFQWKGFLPAFSRTHPNPHFALKVFSNERLPIIVGRFVYDFIKGKVNLQGSFVLTPLSPRPLPSPPPFWVVILQWPTAFLFYV